MSLSTATPSLGGALPKLATLKIGYEVARYDYDYARKSRSSSGVNLMSFTRLAAKSEKSMRLRAQTSLMSSEVKEEGQLIDSVNVLAAETEAGMSSSSFTIPRRATIDADVS